MRDGPSSASGSAAPSRPSKHTQAAAPQTALPSAQALSKACTVRDWGDGQAQPQAAMGAPGEARSRFTASASVSPLRTGTVAARPPFESGMARPATCELTLAAEGPGRNTTKTSSVTSEVGGCGGGRSPVTPCSSCSGRSSSS